SYDIIIIGGGPGGYVAAIRAAQLGMKVACVEKEKVLGGTCLRVGCIPSKALLHASEKFHEAGHDLAALGVKVVGIKLDLPGMMKHKTDVVNDNTKGIEFLFKKNKVDWLKGEGSIPAAGQVKVGDQTYAAKHIIIATGSSVTPLPGIEIDEKQIVSSTGALSLEKVPENLVVIGAGVIGLELGSVWARLGANVQVIEYLDRILPGMDGEVAKSMQKLLEKQGLQFKLSSKVTAAKTSSGGVSLTVEPAAGGKAETVKADVVLVAVGRRANTDGLGLDKIGVAMDARGRVETDGHYKTNVAGIYAVGDVIAGLMLAHKAEEDGVVCVEHIAGQKSHVDYNLVPGVVYTAPEVAAIGQTEEQLKEAGVKYKVGKFNYTANGRARAMNATTGFVKILADAATDRVLGAHIIGASAGEMIHEIATHMEYGGSAEDIARTCHAHPTLSEVVKEAALAVDGRALHS
ncbi:MAG TPA: dihydrolipoyl dehydrogenase, partial [Alphaproteobacteria bacterium]|nr:dihydrolipoyl dehydrogenase [Alphaproteobacteria bacterium]